MLNKIISFSILSPEIIIKYIQLCPAIFHRTYLPAYLSIAVTKEQLIEAFKRKAPYQGLVGTFRSPGYGLDPSKGLPLCQPLNVNIGVTDSREDTQEFLLIFDTIHLPFQPEILLTEAWQGISTEKRMVHLRKGAEYTSIGNSIFPLDLRALVPEVKEYLKGKFKHSRYDLEFLDERSVWPEKMRSISYEALSKPFMIVTANGQRIVFIKLIQRDHIERVIGGYLEKDTVLEIFPGESMKFLGNKYLEITPDGYVRSGTTAETKTLTIDGEKRKFQKNKEYSFR